MKKNIVEDFLNNAYSDEDLMINLSEMMYDIRQNNKSKLFVEWETNFDDGSVLFITFSFKGSSINLFDNNGNEILLSSKIRKDIEDAADGVILNAEYEAKEILREEQDIRDTERILRYWV